jgi:hypothetical protein
MGGGGGVVNSKQRRDRKREKRNREGNGEQTAERKTWGGKQRNINI